MSSNPIMIVTCKSRKALVLENTGPQLLNRANELSTNQKNLSDKNLKSDPELARVVALDCEGACPLDFICDVEFNQCLYTGCLVCPPGGVMSYDTELGAFYCEFATDGGIEYMNHSFAADASCDCPDGTVRGNAEITVFVGASEPDETFTVTNTCVNPDCYIGEFAEPIFDCTNFSTDNILEVTLCGDAPGQIADNSFVPVDAISNCEFLDFGNNAPIDFNALNTTAISSGMEVGLGPFMSNCFTFKIKITVPTLPSTITFAGDDNDLDIPVNVCGEAIVKVDDPCDCSSPYNEATGLYTDLLTVSMLTAFQPVILNVNTEGFKDMMGNPILPGTNLGSADAGGLLEYVFYRAEGERTKIDLDVASAFIAETTCPDQDACRNPIPTLGEWGLISLGLMITIFGVARIKEMEQTNKITFE